MFNFFKIDKPPEKLLWQQFKGKKNTEEILFDKAKSVAPFVVHMITEDSKLLFQKIKKTEKNKKDDKFDEVFFEMALFYLHFVDRIAFQYLEVKQRNIFVDTLFVEVRELLSHVYESEIDATQFRSSFGEAYNDRQNEYGQYKKLFAEKDEGTGGTLFWEFGKRLARVLSSDKDILVKMYIQTRIYTLAALQLPELFKV